MADQHEHEYKTEGTVITCSCGFRHDLGPSMEQMERALASIGPRTWPWQEWLVSVPLRNKDGLVIQHFDVSTREAFDDKLRAALNPQRNDRSVEQGTFTCLRVDGTLWMSDTPAEVEDLLDIDKAMAEYPGGSMLIVGLGIGLVLQRAMMYRDFMRIDVVEREPRVIAAVGPHYKRMAKKLGVKLNIHQADIWEWEPEPDIHWDLAFFDIWPTISMDDLPEVVRLEEMYGPLVTTFTSWAQDERLAQKHRIETKTGWY